MAEALIVPLRELDRGSIEVAGGKAANLGELLRAGLPVPDGFCVTTAAYALAADGIPVDDAIAARKALLAGPIPAAVAEAVSEAYGGLGPDASIASRPGSAAPAAGPDAKVAVRSSATAEDLPFASFAGQQDTFLNVAGADAVLDATRRCWASLWTDRAAAYRAANDVDPRSVRLAVVVQRMVEAAVAGVMFTANPLTGRRGHAVIDAAPGLGEAVVSGKVTPDHFVVDTATDAVLERRAAGEAPPCLSDDQLHALAALARRVERVYSREPQDTEFAVDHGGRVWLTQARPITTLFPLPADAPPPQSGNPRVYFSVNVAQGVLGPLTPMGLQGVRLYGTSIARAFGVPVQDPLTGPGIWKEAGQRVFLDWTPLVRNRLGRRVARNAASRLDALTNPMLDAVIDDPRFAPAPAGSTGGGRRIAAALARHQLPQRLVHALRDPAGARAEALGRVDAILDKATAPEDASMARRLDLVERWLVEDIAPIIVNLAPLMSAGMSGFDLAFRLLGSRTTAEERDEVRRALPNNPTTEMDLALWALAARLRDDADAAEALRQRSPGDLAAAYAEGALPAGLQEGLAAFLRDYGHRGVAEIDLGRPRWADDPAQILLTLGSYLSAGGSGGESPGQRFQEAAEHAEKLVDELAARRGRLARPLVHFGLRRGRDLAGLREAPKAYLVALTAKARAQLLMVGEDLAEAGCLERAEDVWFLDLRDARRAVAGADVRPLVRGRRAAYEAELRRRHVPRLLLSDGTEPGPGPAAGAAEAGLDAVDASGPARASETGGALRGTPASAGIVTGLARVVRDPAGVRLEPGEILVAPSTDPGWTPLFLTAGGLVVEMGGPMSHGAVVAREHGIPAVVGVPGATDRIRNGDRITVDGAAGTVVTGDAIQVSWDPPVPGSKWVRRQVTEHMPDPLSPLFDELYVQEGLDRPIDALVALTMGDVGFRWEEMMDRPIFATVNGFAYQRVDFHIPPRLVLPMVRGAVNESRMLFGRADAYWRDDALPRYLGTVDRWRSADAAALPDDDLLRGIRELAWADAEYWYACALVVGAAKVTDGLLNRFLAVAVGRDDLTSGLFLRGFESKTLEGDAALEALAERVRGSAVLRRAVVDTPVEGLRERLRETPEGDAVLAGLDAYFRDYGHQIYSLDFAEPTQAEDPLPTLRSMQARVAGEPRDVRALQATIARERDAAIENTARALDPVRRRAFHTLLRWAQRYGPGREAALFYLGSGWPTLRGMARELGCRLAAAGTLETPDDVYFLQTVELAQAIAARAAGTPKPELAELAAARRALRERRMHLEAPAAVPPKAGLRLGPFDMSAFETQKRNVEGAGSLQGFPVSPGQVTGTASVVLGPAEFGNMTPGSILVCPTTTPAWTPLFSQARGLVTDIGGILAHGSIVAREYGIPAVMGTGAATHRIRHGQLITVDGDRGLVHLT